MNPFVAGMLGGALVAGASYVGLAAWITYQWRRFGP